MSGENGRLIGKKWTFERNLCLLPPAHHREVDVVLEQDMFFRSLFKLFSIKIIQHWSLLKTIYKLSTHPRLYFFDHGLFPLLSKIHIRATDKIDQRQKTDFLGARLVSAYAESAVWFYSFFSLLIGIIAQAHSDWRLWMTNKWAIHDSLKEAIMSEQLVPETDTSPPHHGLLTLTGTLGKSLIYTWFPTMWFFDKYRLRRTYAAFF